uniref:Uncharacterized protein n=1 Tax=Arundo donax TaxID=35708 RepID=A0A0A9GRG1_ARUDO
MFHMMHKRSILSFGGREKKITLTQLKLESLYRINKQFCETPDVLLLDSFFNNFMLV